MGRIKYSNGNRVNHVRKIQGEFLKKQDTESYLLSKKMNNGNNIQEKNTPNIDALPNIPAIPNYALNLPKQNSIDPINGAIPHTLTAQGFLTLATLLSAASAAFPNTTAPPNKAIDNPNSSLSRVTSPTGVSKMPVLFDTTPATTSTSQNHAPSLIREKDGLILHDAYGNIILGSDASKLTFSYNLDIDRLEQQLKNSKITELCLWALKIDPQKVQKIGEFLKDSNVKVLSILHGSIEGINFGTMLTDTKVTTLNLAYNGIGNKGAIGLESLKGTNVQELNLSDNRIGNKRAKGLIESLEETNVKVLDLSHNNMSDKKVNDIIPELKKILRLLSKLTLCKVLNSVKRVNVTAVAYNDLKALTLFDKPSYLFCVQFFLEKPTLKMHN
ncbi:hypothetical protein [Candidatus Tisiphia endosymbiont of Dascillus cervinus]|uniref:hypothetical protein n=1 Tax=Candidatus Tisiphia endosymbiont of Dascillus cervinus TaxID=3066253 RepID=UPI00312CA353